jgi:PAS domain S-box-containing protein
VQPHTDRRWPADDAGPVRVLHVDDDPAFLEMAARRLEREDDRFVVETETDTDAVLDRLAAARFDCVVSDYDMPGRTGLELLEVVRAEHPALPFVLFTGKGSEEVASEAISAGVTDYLQKGGGADRFAILANRVANVAAAYRSRRALEERNRRLETLVDTLPGVVYRCRNEPGWPMEAVEGECEALTGHAAVALEEGAVGWGEDVVHPDDRERVFEAVQRALAAGDAFEVTYRVVTASGATKWVWERGREVEAPAGEPAVLEGFVTDITARRAREAEVERTNALLETLFDALPLGVLAEDGAGEVMAANRRLVDLFDLAERSEALVGTDAARVAGALADRYADPGAVAVDVDRPGPDRAAAREELRLADGRTVERTVRRLELPDGDGRLWVYRDVTDRVERERKLDRLRDRATALAYTETTAETTRVATEAADEVIGAPLSGVHLVTGEGDALEPSAVAESVDETFEDPLRYPRDAEPGSRAAFVWDAFERGESVRVDDLHASEAVTEPTPARSAIVHPVGRHGVFVISSGEPDDFDDTDAALVELLATSLETALDRVEREAELRRGRDELRRRNERLDEFTGVVSHDLRNPLNVAQGRLSLAREHCKCDPGSEHLAAVAEAHDRMDALIEDLLAVARNDDAVTDPEPVDLRALVDRCWATVETGPASLVVDADRTVLADSGRLRQLLENLFRNAVEHGDASVVTVGDLPEGGGFSVADDGTGIPEAERESVFEVGYSTSEDGTGFGLSIVRRVAEAHGWDVRATESESGGARFEVRGVEAGDRAATREADEGATDE